MKQHFFKEFPDVRSVEAFLATEALLWQNTVSLVTVIGEKVGVGTGFCVGPDLVLTARHCVIEEGRRTDPGRLRQTRIVHPFSRQDCGIRDYEDGKDGRACDLVLLKVAGKPFANIKHLEFVSNDEFSGNFVTVPDIRPGDALNGCRAAGDAQGKDSEIAQRKNDVIARQKTLEPKFRSGFATSIELQDAKKRDIAAVFELSVQRGFSGSPVVVGKTGKVASVVTRAVFPQLSPGFSAIAGKVSPDGYSLNSHRTFGPSPDDVRNFVTRARARLQAAPSGV